jgi:predicted DNA-binding protein (MmcQ/YjbR family)
VDLAARTGDDGHVDNMTRLETLVATLPEAERVDVQEWGDHPTFRVRGKNFVFSDQEARGISLKLPKDEAAAVVATDPSASPAGYGLGRHGWVSLDLGEGLDDERWEQVEEWVVTSYRLVAPRRLARLLDAPPA